MPGPNAPYSQLSANQAIVQSYDEATDRLRVDATVTASIGEVKITDGSIDATITTVGPKNGLDVNIVSDVVVDISHTDDSIRLGDGVSLITSTNVTGKQGLDVNIINPISVDLDGTTATPDSVLTIGSENGLTTGVKRAFVNNLKQQILTTQDVQEAITWANFGTKQERITQIDYTSATISGNTARKIFTYTLVGTQYRLDSTNWSII